MQTLPRSGHQLGAVVSMFCLIAGINGGKSVRKEAYKNECNL